MYNDNIVFTETHNKREPAIEDTTTQKGSAITDKNDSKGIINFSAR